MLEVTNNDFKEVFINIFNKVKYIHSEPKNKTSQKRNRNTQKKNQMEIPELKN